MKSFAILLTFIIFVSFALDAKECSFFGQYGQQRFELDNHSYTPFWAQEFVGVDLVKDEMGQLPWSSLVPFVVIDAGFHAEHLNLDFSPEVVVSPFEDSHGTCVANIINGEGPYGMSRNVEYRRLIGSSFSFSTTRRVNELIADGEIPRILSNSMHWASFEDRVAAEKLIARGTIWVASAGNNFPDPMNEHKEAAGVITVGSRRPNTFVSLFSQESPALTITAPSEHHVATVGENGEHRMFGQTSAAAPIVSGSLANAVALLTDLTMEEAKTLLVKTALPAPNQVLLGDLNPAGIVNSYKLYRVAKKIAVRCGYNNGVISPMVRRKCKEEMIGNGGTYRNPMNAYVQEKMLGEITAFFEKEDGSNSCQKKRYRFHQLRKIAFLEQNNEKVWNQLATIAEEYGYDGHADFYKNLALSSSISDSKKLAKAIAIQGCYQEMHESRELLATFSAEDWSEVYYEILQNSPNSQCYRSVMDSIFYLRLQDNRLKAQVISIFQDKKESLVKRLLAARALERIKNLDTSVFEVVAKDQEEVIDARIAAYKLAGSIADYTLEEILADKSDDAAFANSSIITLFINKPSALNLMTQYALYRFINNLQGKINLRVLAIEILKNSGESIRVDILNGVSDLLQNEKSDLDIKLASFDLLHQSDYRRLPEVLIYMIQNVKEKTILRKWALDKLELYKPISLVSKQLLESVYDDSGLVAAIKEFLNSN